MNIPAFKFSQIIKDRIGGMKLGLLAAENISVLRQSRLADEELERLDKFIKEKFAASKPAADEVVSAVRRMYRRIGWEPTRYRPSSEAMIRRFLKSLGLYRINNIVDLGNVTSTRFHLPMGLYDLHKIEGDVWLDVGREGETYQGISKELIHAAGKLILRDESGVFGNPTADSLRTSISAMTQSVLAIFFTPPDVSEKWLEDTLNYLRKLYAREFHSAEIEQHYLIIQ